MTTLYEHKSLGSRVCMVNAIFNIPFLTGYGTINLYEKGLTFLDNEGVEKYIVSLEDLNISYERFVNIRNLKYISKATIFTRDAGLKCRGIKSVFKRVKGSYYGKLTIKIDELDEIILLDNRALKYKEFYEKINSLRFGKNPLILSKKYSFIKFLKYKLNI